MMTTTELPPPILITHPAELKKLAGKVIGEKQIAVDTESNSLYAYHEQVCLIQFSIPGEDYLVDPLALNDLSPLAPIFINPDIEKIFHASEYDLICLKRDFGFEFANLFDTFTAARILGRTEVGLGSILEEEFSIHVNKRYQRANWGRRPLPSHMLAYAQIDTHYLIPLRERLANQLMEAELLPLAQEDFKRMCHINGNTHKNGDKNGDCWKINGAGDLSPQKAAVLQELCYLRDRIARRINQPLFKVYSNRVLLELAKESPQSIDDMQNMQLLNSRQIKRDGEAMISAIKKGLVAQPVYPARPKRPNDQFIFRLDNLRKWRKLAAQRMGVSSDIVLPRDLLFTIAEMNPGNQTELQEILSSVPWRMDRFGKQIIHAIHNG